MAVTRIYLLLNDIVETVSLFNVYNLFDSLKL